jgi:hypothetical protein
LIRDKRTLSPAADIEVGYSNGRIWLLFGAPAVASQAANAPQLKR